MRIIPAIDIIDGHPVRLSEGDYSRKTSYRLSALEAAKAFEDGGLTHLHLVDLDAAAGRGSNIHVLEEIAEKTSLSVDFGGGIRTEESVRCAFDAGASAVNVGSAAAKNPEMVCGWNDLYPGRIILSADARDGKVAVSGWMESTGIDLIPFIGSFINNGLKSVVVTDISKDGMLSGPSYDLYKRILSVFPEVDLIASGGVSSYGDLVQLGLIGVHSVIVGKAYYEGFISIREMKEAECLPNG